MREENGSSSRHSGSVLRAVSPLICMGIIIIIVDHVAIASLGTRASNTFIDVGTPVGGPGRPAQVAVKGIAVNPLPPPVVSGDAAQNIRRLLDDQQQAWNRGDLNRFMAGYWKSDKLSFYSGKDKTQGWQATLDRYRKRYQGEGREMGKLSFSELEIDLLGPNHALVRGRWQVVLSKEKSSGLFTLLVKKLPEGWRIVHDHTSKD